MATPKNIPIHQSRKGVGFIIAVLSIMATFVFGAMKSVESDKVIQALTNITMTYLGGQAAIDALTGYAEKSKKETEDKK